MICSKFNLKITSYDHTNSSYWPWCVTDHTNSSYWPWCVTIAVHTNINPTLAMLLQL